MDYFESLKKTTADVTYKAVKTTEKLVEVSKLKYRIYDINMQIEKIQARIGNEVYTSYVEEREISGSVDEMCRKIDELKEKVEILNGKLNEVREA